MVTSPTHPPNTSFELLERADSYDLTFVTQDYHKPSGRNQAGLKLHFLPSQTDHDGLSFALNGRDSLGQACHLFCSNVDRIINRRGIARAGCELGNASMRAFDAAAVREVRAGFETGHVTVGLARGIFPKR